MTKNQINEDFVLGRRNTSEDGYNATGKTTEADGAYEADTSGDRIRADHPRIAEGHETNIYQSAAGLQQLKCRILRTRRFGLHHVLGEVP